ncbi:MAG: sigma-70 family RNA polymerase sigma factor [Spirochaeta sp.]|jgi:RNA polymerase sigma-70 factor (ECF subfamily)|nr:sigma-70 family RNA polymerase sigma factor [Spirochaeta sp.]
MAVDVERYYRVYGPMVLRRCRAMLKDEDAAVDAMQDTFVRVLRYGDRLHGKAPSSLLYTIATNVCLNAIRSRGRDRSEAVGATVEHLAATGDHSDQVLVGHFLDRLFTEQTESTRQIATRYYVNGLTLEETAAQSGLSVSGVRKRLGRLRESGRARFAA